MGRVCVTLTCQWEMYTKGENKCFNATHTCGEEGGQQQQGKEADRGRRRGCHRSGAAARGHKVKSPQKKQRKARWKDGRAHQSTCMHPLCAERPPTSTLASSARQLRRWGDATATTPSRRETRNQLPMPPRARRTRAC